MSDELEWPPEYERTEASERTSAPFDTSLTRKQAFESIVEELERWGASTVEVSSASQHYADRPNIPHQHDKPEDSGVVARFRREGESADTGYAIACDAYTSQLENARAISLYARRKRLAERCGVTTGNSEFDTARLPPGDDEEAVVAGAAPTEDPYEVLGLDPELEPDVLAKLARQRVAAEHPDRGGDEAEFKRLSMAREAVLGDE
jgi:hypothetical protein